MSEATDAAAPASGAAGQGDPLERFLDELEAPPPGPSSGTAAAAVAAIAAALVVMVGRGSPAWPEGAGVAAQARALRARLRALGAEDARAYALVLGALSDHDSAGPAQRDFALGRALIDAAEVPLRIAAAAADVAALAALAAGEGADAMRPDATAAAMLAESAVRAAAHLVDVNLAIVPGDARAEQAARIGKEAEAARAAALRTT